jgi:hypothetical protein
MNSATGRTKNIPRRSAPPPSKGDMSDCHIRHGSLFLRGISEVLRLRPQRPKDARSDVPLTPDRHSRENGNPVPHGPQTRRPRSFATPTYKVPFRCLPRDSRRAVLSPISQSWIPACAGMTEKMGGYHSMLRKSQGKAAGDAVASAGPPLKTEPTEVQGKARTIRRRADGFWIQKVASLKHPGNKGYRGACVHHISPPLKGVARSAGGCSCMVSWAS